jgi:hypothetical protein
VLDHQPPLALHFHVEGTGCCVGVPSCKPCSDKQGGELAWRSKYRTRGVDQVPDPAGFEPDDAVWNVDWLASLRDVPDEATWPRLMSPPHPTAVGSYGDEAIRWISRRGGIPVLRWWQQLALVRILEHDTNGRLCWLGVLLSTSRQSGKSMLLRGLGLWRIHQADRFGEPQLVLHTAKDLPICKEVFSAAREWAHGHGYEVRKQVGYEEITHPLGSRWLVRGKGSVYGYPVSFAIADEAWGVAPDVVEDGLEPTMMERRSPQLLLTSTAHRKTTRLFTSRRAAVLADLANPGQELLLEWSARRQTSLDDRAAWRQASPHWGEERERVLEVRLARVEAGESDDAEEADPIESFRSQFLNIWPAHIGAGPGEPLVTPERWVELWDPQPGGTGRTWIAVEDHFGRGASVAAVAACPDGRFEVDGWLCPTVDEAFADARRCAEFHESATIIVGASLGKRMPRADTAGSAETRHGLPLLREFIDEGRIVHEGCDELGDQLCAVRVRELTSGLVLVAGQRSDLVRALLWALRAAAVPRPAPSIH